MCVGLILFILLGRSMSKTRQVSDETARIIDMEIRAIIDRNYQCAHRILKENLDILHNMKEVLIKYETINTPQIDDLMARCEVRLLVVWSDNRSQASYNEPTRRQPYRVTSVSVA
jgi:cell division protease FtsH